jgi:hypothetical protein
MNRVCIARIVQYKQSGQSYPKPCLVHDPSTPWYSPRIEQNAVVLRPTLGEISA